MSIAVSFSEWPMIQIEYCRSLPSAERTPDNEQLAEEIVAMAKELKASSRHHVCRALLNQMLELALSD